MKIRHFLPVLIFVSLVALVVGCNKADDDNPAGVLLGGGVPTDDPGLGLAGGGLLADGEDRLSVAVLVTDTAGRPLIRVPVKFSTTLGFFDDPNVVTDFDGRASVVLTSIASPVDVVAEVCANVPVAVDSTALFKDGAEPLRVPSEPPLVRLVATRSRELSKALETAENRSCVNVTMLGVEVALSTDTDRLPADGVRSTGVTALVREATSGVPVSGKRVRFGTSSGGVDSEFITDTNGEANATLRSSTVPGTASVVAFVGTGLADTTAVEFTPIRFSLATQSVSLAADGVATARLIATVLSENRNPLAGLAVNFTTDLGTITSPVVTNSSGQAIAELTGEGVGGTATVGASFGEVASASLSIPLTETFRPASVVVSADPPNLVADGLSRAVIAATVLDSVGNAVANGLPVTFEILSGGGTLISEATTVGGVARTNLTSSTAAGVASVRASTAGVSGTVSVAYEPGLPSSIDVSASPASIVGNGIETSTISATVRDLNGNPLGAGLSVSFTASRGEITTSALTDPTGTATATYTSDLGSGPVQINVGSAGAQGLVSLTQTSGTASQIVLVSVNRQSIGIEGSGDPQTATMVFQVLSSDGIPLGPNDAVTVQFELVALSNGGAGSGEFLQPTSDVTDENGIVRTTLNSGTVSGATETVARITSVVPNIESRVVPISIDGGLPVADNLTVASAELNIPGLCFYNLETEVIGLVFDEFQNPVPEGSIVYFTSQYAGIQAADTTDEHGRSSVWLISANELPPIWPGSGPAGFPYGFVEVYAQTANAAGEQIRDSTYVLFSGCTRFENLSPSSFSIGNGGCQTFTFNLWDLNHNPLAGGTKITITSTQGDLVGDTDVTLPDTQFGFTSFSFALCDDDAGDLDPPTSASVSIKITSPNNDVTALVTGTID